MASDRRLTTEEVAQKVHIDRVTLQEWIRTQRVRAPKPVIRNGRSVRLWSPRDVKLVREVKARTYRRGRGRKRQASHREPQGFVERAKTRGGRPEEIHAQTLLNHREQFLGLLAQGWGDVGWALPRATTIEALRAALSPLARMMPGWYRLTPFLRETTQEASRSDIQKTTGALNDLLTRRSVLQSELQTAKDQVALAQGALDGASTDKETWRTEHGRRTTVRDERQLAWDRLGPQCLELEATRDDQVAYYVQHELLAFITSPRKHARNPPNLAGAMAGLPDVSASYGFQQCAKEPSSGWPFSTYQIFELIDDTWSQVGRNTKDALLQALPATIQALQVEHVRTQLERDWLCLCEAINDTDVEVEDRAAVPYRIVATFWKKCAVPRTQEDIVRAEMAQRDLLERQRALATSVEVNLLSQP